MKISTRGRYGLKAIVDMAAYSEAGEPVSLKSIAQRQGISEAYLEQLLAALRKEGIVKSIRGAQGGYCLNRRTDEISVGDLLRCLEGPFNIVECISEKEKGSCGNVGCGNCVTKNVWEKMSDGLSIIADSITLKELVDDYIEANKIGSTASAE